MIKNTINVEGQKELLSNDVRNVARGLLTGEYYTDYLQLIANMIEEYDPEVAIDGKLLIQKLEVAANKMCIKLPTVVDAAPVPEEPTDFVNYPLEAVGNLENACYDMLYALDNSTLTEVVNETAEAGYPFEHSLDEQLHAIIDWTEIVVKKYQQSPTVRKLEQLLAGTQDANEIAVLTECIKKLEAK